MAATESIACMRKLRDYVQMDARSYLQPVVSPLCGNTSVSKRMTALKGSRTIAMQVEGCPWQRHNQFEEPSSHEASFNVCTMTSLRVIRRLRESSFKTFVRFAEVKEVPPHSTCAVQQPLTG